MRFELSEEQQAIRQMVREFAVKEIEPRLEEINEKGVFHTPVIRKAAELGLLGMTVPSEYGGAGVDFVSYCIAIEEVSRVCGSTGLTLAAHNGLGTSHIFHQGNEAQKRHYAPKLASGEWIGCWALTEPGSGSDAAGLATTAVRRGDEWVLNGTKVFATNGHFADVVTVMAKHDPAKGSKGITAFIVHKGTPGFKLGKLEEKLGLHGSATSELIFEDCRVPNENVIGGDAGVGQGFVGALKTLDAGRIAIGAFSLGIAQGAFDASLKYAKERQQFGKPIGAFQAIQFKLATMATEIDAARLLVYRAAWLRSQGKPFKKEASMAKLFATEMAMRAANQAVQIHGGNGYTTEFPVHRYFCDAKLGEIGEGTSEVQRMVIAQELGLPRGE